MYQPQVYESRLENLMNGEDWREMCQTTPTVINGKTISSPTSCGDWVSSIELLNVRPALILLPKRLRGKWEIWRIDDPKCL